MTFPSDNECTALGLPLKLNRGDGRAREVAGFERAGSDSEAGEVPGDVLWWQRAIGQEERAADFFRGPEAIGGAVPVGKFLHERDRSQSDTFRVAREARRAASAQSIGIG